MAACKTKEVHKLIKGIKQHFHKTHKKKKKDWNHKNARILSKFYRFGNY